MTHFIDQPAVYLVVDRLYIHQALHFLSGLIGCFLGCWAYAALAKRREKRTGMKSKATDREES
jgi:hypothetical protein